MAVRIQADAHAPTVSIELKIARALPDYDLEEVEMPTPRDVDVILVSQGFADLLDDARGLLRSSLEGTGLEVVQFTGAIVRGEESHFPGMWLVLRESGAADGKPMSAAGQQRAAAMAEQLRARFRLS